MIKKWFIKKIVLAIFFCFILSSSVSPGTAQFTYDNLNRLVQVQYEDGTTIQYTYDAAGNRLTKEVTASAQGSSSPTGPGSKALAYAPATPNFPPPSGHSTEKTQ
jgi:YD repeat-containing protein